MSACYSLVPAGALLALRVTPNAGRDAIDGLEARADGRTALKLRVSAAPDKGRANDAVLTLLAKALGRPKSTLSVTRGTTARDKLVLVSGDPDALVPALAALCSPTCK